MADETRYPEAQWVLPLSFDGRGIEDPKFGLEIYFQSCGQILVVKAYHQIIKRGSLIQGHQHRGTSDRTTRDYSPVVPENVNNPLFDTFFLVTVEMI